MENSPIWTSEQKLILPDFDEFKRAPRNYDTHNGIPLNSYGILDTTRLSVSAKILGIDASPTDISCNPEAEK